MSGIVVSEKYWATDNLFTLIILTSCYNEVKNKKGLLLFLPFSLKDHFFNTGARVIFIQYDLSDVGW